MSGLTHSLIAISPYKLIKSTSVGLSKYYWKKFCIGYMNLKVSEKERFSFAPLLYIINQMIKMKLRKKNNKITKFQINNNLYRKKDSYFLQLALVAMGKISNLIEEIQGNFNGLKHQNVFMHGKTKREVYFLNKNKPRDVPAKFWAQRYRLLSKYDDGIKMDNAETWYSITPEAISKTVAFRLEPENLVIDGFCGIGGNSLSFAKYCKVIAIDVKTRNLEVCERNKYIYNISENLECICGNFVNLAPLLKSDVVFIGPPWGGLSYMTSNYNVNNMGNTFNLKKLLYVCKRVATKIIVCLPKNCDFVQLISIREKLGLGIMEIQQNFSHQKCKMWTIFFGFHKLKVRY